MNECFFYDSKGTPTDRVTSQNRLPECYLYSVSASQKEEKKAFLI